MASPTLFDDDFDLDDELSQQRDERISPYIAVAAAIGLAVGLFLWGSVAISVLSAGESIAGDTDPSIEGAPGVSDEQEGGPIDCSELGGALALSPARAAQYREQCSTPAPVPSPSPTPDTRLNRADCATIRGTEYHSPEERRWFLANCVTR